MTPEHEAGRYRLKERLNPDGNAWLAEDLEEPTRPVVVKLLPDGSDVIAARHLARTMKEAGHAGLSVPVDAGETRDGRPYLVYLWTDGHTVREVLNASGPLSFGRAAAIVQAVGEALGFLHERGIVHGAISPEHIVIGHAHGRDTVTILNVGWYRVTGQTSESPAYLAPEQLAGAATAKSDIFSLAAVVAEMLTGRRAFRYGSLNELERMHRIGIPRGQLRKLRPKLPLRVEEELRHAMSWDPARRPVDAQIFTTRLAEFLGGERTVTRRRLYLLAAAAVAVIAIGIRNCRRRWGL